VSLFDDLFTPIEVRNQRDIRAIYAAMPAGPSTTVIADQARKNDERLHLLCKTLLELVVAKGLATREEITVLMQQTDLSDGVEDGRLTDQRRKAPRCRNCTRFLNPKREACIYCGASIAAEAGDPYRGGGPAPAPVVTVACTKCGETVPQNETLFTGSGLRCERCYDPTD